LAPHRRLGSTPADRNGSDWLTRSEAATYARVSLSKIDRAISAGTLTSTKRDGRRLTRRLWIDAWLLAALFALTWLAAVGFDLCLAFDARSVLDVLPVQGSLSSVLDALGLTIFLPVQGSL
jgi:hypothetical protein